jgi:3-dehydrosphinganine reductase
MTTFKDKVVIVTGGSSGIGQALARQLAEAGAHVHIWARREALLKETLSTLGGEGKHAYQVVDVGKREQVENAYERVRQEAGVPDIIINNAGVTYPNYVEEIPIEIFEQMIQINYLGTVYLSQLALQDMLKRGSGHIVNVSSTVGAIGVFGFSAYGASKFAVRGYSDVLRSEMKYRGIKVSIIFPPDTDTPMMENEMKYKPFETKELSTAAGLLSPEEVARIALKGIAKDKYLILPGASNKFLFWLNGVLGAGSYLLMDFLIKQALKKKAKLEAKQ